MHNPLQTNTQMCTHTQTHTCTYTLKYTSIHSNKDDSDNEEKAKKHWKIRLKY